MSQGKFNGVPECSSQGGEWTEMPSILKKKDWKTKELNAHHKNTQKPMCGENQQLKLIAVTLGENKSKCIN